MKKFLLFLLSSICCASNINDLKTLSQDWLVNDTNFIDFSSMAATWEGGLAAYKITITATNGNVTRMPDQDEYFQNDSVQLTAIASSGYTFSHWSGDLTGSDNPATVIITSNKNITANFISLAPVIDIGAIANPQTIVFENCIIDLSQGVSGAGTIDYVIDSLPSGAFLIATQEYAKPIMSSMLPYIVPEHNSHIVLRATSTGTKTFNYHAYNGSSSNIATMTVNVSANSPDSLTFTGTETEIVTIPDSNELDIIDGRGICFYFRTLQADCGLFYKRAGANGYYVCVENGRIRFYLVQPNGTAIGYGRTDMLRVDTGRWTTCGFTYNAGLIAIFVCDVEQVNGSGYYVAEYVNQPIADYTNSEPVIIGKSPGKPNFVGEFDRLRFYSGCTGEAWDLQMIYIMGVPEGRQDTSDVVSEWYGTPIVPLVRFMFDEGVGTTTTDDRCTPNLVGNVGSMPWLANYDNNEAVIYTSRYNFSNIKRSSVYNEWIDNLISSRERY